jgi:4-oxalocrotonate tautomerase
MPEVIVYAAKGRNAQQKKALCQDITNAVSKHFNAPIEAVVVQIVESDLDSKSKGGVMFSER